MRHPNSARFHEILQELGLLHDRKQSDYGRGDDPFANIRSSEEWGITPWVGAMMRLSDKVRRLQSLIRNGKLENESAEDSLRDIPVYAVIALVLFEQERSGKQDILTHVQNRMNSMPAAALPELLRVLADLEDFYNKEAVSNVEG